MSTIEAQRGYKCGVCQETYPSRSELKKHLLSHSGDRRYMCHQCDRTFSSNFYLVRHQRSHTGERPFVCPQCNKSFKCGSVLSRHRRIHAAQLPFQCQVCAKGFSQKTSLVIHLRTHTGERPFRCPICGRGFCSSSALIRHEQSHRQDGNVEGGGRSMEAGIKLKVRDVSFWAKGEGPNKQPEDPSTTLHVPEGKRESNGRCIDMYFENDVHSEDGLVKGVTTADTGPRNITKVEECIPDNSTEQWHPGQRAGTKQEDQTPDNFIERWHPGQRVVTKQEDQAVDNTTQRWHRGQRAVTEQEDQTPYNSTERWHPEQRVVTKQEDQAVDNTTERWHPGQRVVTEQEDKVVDNTTERWDPWQRDVIEHEDQTPYNSTERWHPEQRVITKQEDQAVDNTTERWHPGQGVVIEQEDQAVDTGTEERMGNNSSPTQGNLSRGFMCLECGKTFVSLPALVVHYATHTGDLPSCPDCGKTFRHRSSLTRHQNSQCSIRTKRHSIHQTRFASTIDPLSLHKCGLCHISFPGVNQLRRHLRTHTREYRCDVCTQCFSQKTGLISHLRTHTAERPVHCQRCGGSFSSGSALVRHEKSCRRGGKPPYQNLESSEEEPRSGTAVKPETEDDPLLASDVSNRDMSESWTSDINPLDTSDEGGFICPDCGITSASQSLYNVHRQVHSGNGRLTCSPCGKVFSRRSTLIRHQRSHCRSAARDPLRTGATHAESTYTCKDCGRRFTGNYFLVRHQRTHTGEQPYRCQVCLRGFSQKTSLEIHVRIHTGERPYVCAVCGRGFCSRSAMVRHQLCHQDRKCRRGEQRGKQRILGKVSWSSDESSREASVDVTTGLLLGEGFEQPVKELVLEPKLEMVKKEMPENANCDKRRALRQRTGHQNGWKPIKSPAHISARPRTPTPNRPFLCTICGKTFRYHSSLSKHINAHRKTRTDDIPGVPRSGQHLYKCGICCEGCTSRSELKKHLLSHSGDRRFMCHQCDRTFSSNFYLVRHQRSHTGERPFVCPQCNKSFKCGSVLSRHRRIHAAQLPFQCEVCAKGFSQKTSLVIHLRTHTGERPFRCQMCGRGFCSSSALIRHEQSHRQEAAEEPSPHTDETEIKPLDCGVKQEAGCPEHRSMKGDQSCDNDNDNGGFKIETVAEETGPDGGAFSQPQPLLSDLQRVQVASRCLVCSDCGYSFSQRSSLLRHKRSHCRRQRGDGSPAPRASAIPAQRLYTCGTCHLKFPSPDDFRRHLSSHNGNQRYPCTECGRTFNCNYYLVRHQRTHTGERPFVCLQCDKSFKCSSVLSRHQRIHFREQPFKCQVCAKGFAQKTSLVIHLRTHTGERPFQCPLCGRSFCSSSSLIRHRQSHQNDSESNLPVSSVETMS